MEDQSHDLKLTNLIAGAKNTSSTEEAIEYLEQEKKTLGCYESKVKEERFEDNISVCDSIDQKIQEILHLDKVIDDECPYCVNMKII
ncbi:MAG: hypothetical protein PHO23_00345 [Candidatus Pacebacteria bacterium]|nr:hypothetical protein [Candidatus Paceibacterota bacterium]